MRVIKLKSQPKWIIRSFMLLGVLLGGIFAFVFHPIGGTNADNNMDIVIQVTVTEPGQTLKINKYFSNSYTVDWEGDGNPVLLSSAITHTYGAVGTKNVILSLTGGADRWKFNGYCSYTMPLIERSVSVLNVKIIQMPSLEEGFGESAEDPGDCFFAAFNFNGAIISLPEDSFDTSYISTVGNYFFYRFNYGGRLSSLPEGSFDTSNIESVGDYFFTQFNDSNGNQTYGGFLTYLPDNSFNTSKIKRVGMGFFYRFNGGGSLSSLPEGSFNLSNIEVLDYSHSTWNHKEGFLEGFNNNGAITYLPDSFKLASVGNGNQYWYRHAFNSPDYTFNRNVSELVDGIDLPFENQSVFSDNQPGRCGVNGRWLASVENACSDEECGLGYYAVNNQCVSDNAGIYYGNGYIEVRNGDNVVYIADKNVGATSSQSVPEFIRKQILIEDKVEEVTNKYDGCDNNTVVLCNSEILIYARQIGIDFYSVDDIFGYIQSDNPFYREVNEYYGNKILNLFYDYLDDENLDENEMGELLKGMQKLFNQNFASVEEGLSYFETLDMDIDSDEFSLYVINRVTGKDFDIEHISDAWDYVNNYDPYNPKYGEVDINSFGTYYFRGNNNGASREELGVADDYYANISPMAYNRGFNGGVMGEDSNNGWIEGNEQDNPCNGEGEYLPTYSDRKEAMDIWSTIYGYDFYSYDYDNYGYSYLQNNLYDDLSNFYDDLLIPNAGYIYQYQEPVCYNKQDRGGDRFINYLAMLFSNPVYAIDIGGYDMVFSSSIYLDMALDSGNNYGRIDNSQISYNNLNSYSYDNSIAAPVRCFLDPEYVEELKAKENMIIPTDDDFEISIGEETYTELPSTLIVTTGNISEINDEPVYGEVTIDFGSGEGARFSKLVQVNIPVEDASRVVVKVKHAGSDEYNFDGLTKNRNASCNDNGRVVDDADKYIGETIRVVDGFASIYTCEASSFIAIGEGPVSAQIIIAIEKGELTIGNETGILDLGHVGVSNDIQEIIGEFGENSFWVEDMKGVESGYYTTISVTDLSGSVEGHTIPANSVYLKTENGIPSLISGSSVSESLVVFGDNIKSWHSNWVAPVTYFHRENTPSSLAGRVGKWGDNLQVKINVPAHTPSDTYRGTIIYTLYDMDTEN